MTECGPPAPLELQEGARHLLSARPSFVELRIRPTAAILEKKRKNYYISARACNPGISTAFLILGWSVTQSLDFGIEKRLELPNWL